MAISSNSISNHFDKGKMKPKDKRDERLIKEFDAISELCQKTSKIAFEVGYKNKRGIPEEYRVYYRNIKSIIGINPDDSPIYDINHIAQLTFPKSFPGTSHPEIKMISDIWHPNIKSKNPSKGRVCLNTKQLSKFSTCADLIYLCGELLQYKNYWAIWEPPYPEDETVAKWVIDYAEPHGIVNRVENIVVDDTDIMDSHSIPSHSPSNIDHSKDKAIMEDNNDGIEIILPEDFNSSSEPNSNEEDDFIIDMD